MASRASGVEVVETVPEHTTFHEAGSTDRWTCPDGSPPGTLCRFADGTLEPGDTGRARFAVRVDAAEESAADRVAAELAAAARAHPAVRSEQVKVLGPAPAPIARLRARYRYRFMLKGAELRSLRAVAAVVRDRIDAGVAPARASLDIDPVSML